MTLDNVQALPLGSQLGDYRLDAVIGHGGFGITYRAFDGQLAKLVAIKEYLPVEFAVRRADGQVVPRGARFAEDFAWGRERFLDEARALARFRHPHIVPVLRFVEANGTAYTVMEFEDGRSVGELLREPGRRLPPEDVRRLAQGLLSGLRAVHAQGFLHRDIKPSNIIIRRDGVPILIDFGAARQAIGGRTRTLTSVLTPQYAPIEQYALDSKQGPWSDIYSAGAVLHHAIAGEPPPEAAGRVGKDPYRPLARTQADRYDQVFLAAVDRALAFAPEDRPQTVDEWRALFAGTVPLAEETPTQIMMPPPIAPNVSIRLGGARREEHQHLVPHNAPPRRKLIVRAAIVAALIIVTATVAWRLQLQDSAPPPAVAVASTEGPPAQSASGQAPAPTPIQTPTAPASNKALLDQAQRAATEARAVFDRAKEAADAARTMAGEARIAAARAARSGLENVERATSDDGASYVGQLLDGKRHGLGVLETKDGDRQAGDWRDGMLNGLGTERQANGTRYEGQWRDGQSNGLGARESPGVERFEGNFVAGQIEGLGMRRTLGAPALMQAGEWRGGGLDGPGIETVGDNERYEGGFRGGRRHGYGQLAGAGDKIVAGRWEDGKLVESAP